MKFSSYIVGCFEEKYINNTVGDVTPFFSLLHASLWKVCKDILSADEGQVAQSRFKLVWLMTPSISTTGCRGGSLGGAQGAWAPFLGCQECYECLKLISW